MYTHHGASQGVVGVYIPTRVSLRVRKRRYNTYQGVSQGEKREDIPTRVPLRVRTEEYTHQGASQGVQL